MKTLIYLAKNYTYPGINKPLVVTTQVLLKSRKLLRLAHFFIDSVSKKSSKTLDKQYLQVLLRPTYLTTWLGDITMLFFSLSNKCRTQFLIPKILSLTDSSSYLVPVLTVQIFLLKLICSY